MTSTALKWVLILTLLTGFKGNIFASHIVGGEFELQYQQANNYRLGLILYFDQINGNPGALDAAVMVHIFRKSDNMLMDQVFLPLVSQAGVPYSNVACSEDFLQTLKLIYRSTIQLPADIYNDPGGYYISYERCCRNYLIDNVFSSAPGFGTSAGQTFYLEFPAVVKNGQPFINSSPRLFPPLRDYGCVDKFYYVDFAGVDDDGDSLVYSMVTPFSTVDTFNPIPANPNPGPYPDVVWRNGFGLDNIMRGNPDLKISQKGLLTVTPKQTGLFVFAVRCEEFRNGVKIGEMRRDFQMLVVDGCVNNAPTIIAREAGSNEVYKEGDIIDFDYTDDEKCVELEVRDVPTSGEEFELVNIRVIPINFNASLDGINITDNLNVPLRDGNDVAKFTVCFPDCPYVPNQPYEIGIIAMDDACPQPEMDTVIVRLNVRPRPNRRPYFNGTPSVVDIEVNETSNGRFEQTFVGLDADLDALSLEVFPFNFFLSDYGMSFEEIRNEDGRVDVKFLWDYDCMTTDFADKSEFTVQLRLDDEDVCLLQDPVNLTLRLKVNLPPNTEPEIFTNRSGIQDETLVFRYNLGDPIRFDVLGVDEDNDEVTITGNGIGFNFSDYDITFNEVTARGLDNPTAPFELILPCSYVVQESDTFKMAFFIEDFDKCTITNRDTVHVDLVVNPPVSSPPLISARSLTPKQIINDRMDAGMGEEIRIRIQGIDFDTDNITLELVEADPRLEGRFTFESVTGVSNIQSDLIWIPECDYFPESLSDSFIFTFQVTDDNCHIAGNDLLTLEIFVEDVISTDEAFAPPNIFTPNGDRYNQFFAMDGWIDEVPIETGLPEDNCRNRFEEVVIVNRWGNVVFKSPDRFFKWYGQDVSAGIYFYTIRYTEKDYKGSVTVRY